MPLLACSGLSPTIGVFWILRRKLLFPVSARAGDGSILVASSLEGHDLGGRAFCAAQLARAVYPGTAALNSVLREVRAAALENAVDWLGVAGCWLWLFG
jgi:hypothetical protein